MKILNNSFKKNEVNKNDFLEICYKNYPHGVNCYLKNISTIYYSKYNHQPRVMMNLTIKDDFIIPDEDGSINCKDKGVGLPFQLHYGESESEFKISPQSNLHSILCYCINEKDKESYGMDSTIIATYDELKKYLTDIEFNAKVVIESNTNFRPYKKIVATKKE